MFKKTLVLLLVLSLTYSFSTKHLQDADPEKCIKGKFKGCGKKFGTLADLDPL